MAQTVVHAASKSAISQSTEVTASDFGQRGILANAGAPGGSQRIFWRASSKPPEDACELWGSSTAWTAPPHHQSIWQASAQELQQLVNTSSVGPICVARTLLGGGHLKHKSTLASMSSHRGRIELNIEDEIALYRAPTGALNTMARGLYAEISGEGMTVLLVHRGWAATAMGALDGSVQAEIAVEQSVSGVVAMVVDDTGSGAHLYWDYSGAQLPW